MPMGVGRGRVKMWDLLILPDFDFVAAGASVFHKQMSRFVVFEWHKIGKKSVSF